LGSAIVFKAVNFISKPPPVGEEIFYRRLSGVFIASEKTLMASVVARMLPYSILNSALRW